MSLKPGTTVGDYRVVKKLGEGGMGEVYLAVHGTLGQKVVLKGLHEQFWRDREQGDRLVREAQAMARLSHPNIVTIYNFLNTPDGAYIVMEHVDGTSFDDLLHRSGLIPPDRAIDLILPALRALEFAHGQGVIHRDLKPANLMLGVSGQVRVLDFGTAKLVDQPGLTRVGTTLGTATYMSPEQLMGGELTPAADLYSVGVTLYEMCTGRLPFESQDTRELFMKIHHEKPVPPSVYTPTIPPALEAAILKSLAKKPRERFASASEMAQALEEVRAGMRPQARPDGRPLRTAAEAAIASAPALEPRRRDFARGGAAAPVGLACAAMGLLGVVGGSALIFLGRHAEGAIAVWAATPLWAVGTGVLGVLALSGGVREVAERSAPAPGVPQPVTPAGAPLAAGAAARHEAPHAPAVSAAAPRAPVHGKVDAPTLMTMVVEPPHPYEHPPMAAQPGPSGAVWRHAPLDPSVAAEGTDEGSEEAPPERIGDRTVVARASERPSAVRANGPT